MMDKQVHISGEGNDTNLETQPFVLTRHWWALALRGLCAVVFGILALAWPGITLEVLVILFGAFVLAAGMFALIAAAGHSERRHRAVLVLQGTAGIVVGAIIHYCGRRSLPWCCSF